jgi:hypothetical protein
MCILGLYNTSTTPLQIRPTLAVSQSARGTPAGLLGSSSSLMSSSHTAVLRSFVQHLILFACGLGRLPALCRFHYRFPDMALHSHPQVSLNSPNGLSRPFRKHAFWSLMLLDPNPKLVLRMPIEGCLTQNLFLSCDYSADSENIWHKIPGI